MINLILSLLGLLQALRLFSTSYHVEAFLQVQTLPGRQRGQRPTALLLKHQQQQQLPTSTLLYAASEDSGAGKKKKKRKKKARNVEVPDDSDNKTEPSKKDLVRAVGETMRRQGGGVARKDDDSSSSKDKSRLLDNLNPFKAGQNLRKSIDATLTSIQSQEKKGKDSIYYLDDDLLEKTGGGFSAASALAGENEDDYIPEVLVVGATGTVGRLIVKRMQLDGRFRVRVLVRDLYTRTLNALGTGVTYCQGDLSDADSLEYAVTDVDKIVFCAGAPRPDEDDFQTRFREYTNEMLRERKAESAAGGKKVSVNSETGRLEEGQDDDDDDDMDSSQSSLDNAEWEQLDSVLQVRAQLAEQVDAIGMKNLVQAYQHVRHADYGTSQAAKRTLFKFERRPEDFNLFAIDDEEDGDNDLESSSSAIMGGGGSSSSSSSSSSDDMDYYEDYEDMDDEYEYEDYYDDVIEQRSGDSAVQTQVQWIRNKFGHGVFVGRIPQESSTGSGGEASIVTSRLRSRDDPDCGIDLASAFAGFVARVCSDGGTYEAFVRTRAYYESGIEYVCEFSTSTKQPRKNKSRNKFTTVRLPFENFKPVQRNRGDGTGAGNHDGEEAWTETPPPFQGKDVRNIGFRYRSSRNQTPLSRAAKAAAAEQKLSSFYLALSYIKLYRSQPEPEFIYVSDARIPPVVKNGMVRHESRQLLLNTANAADTDSDGATTTLLDESALRTATADKGRTEEEIYFKFCGEEILKKSGLSYAIARIPGYNEVPSGEASTIDLSSTPTTSLSDSTALVSRDEVAQICVNALLDPSALNKSFYVSKKKGKATRADEDISAKFKALPADTVM